MYGLTQINFVVSILCVEGCERDTRLKVVGAAERPITIVVASVGSQAERGGA